MLQFFKPRRNNFTHNSILEQSTSECRTLDDWEESLLPKQLLPLYTAYTDDVEEFVHRDGSMRTLLSLREIKDSVGVLPSGCVDLGYECVGVGSVIVYLLSAGVKGR